MVKILEWKNFSIKMVKDSELKCSCTYFVERVTRHVTHDVTGDVSRDSLTSRTHDESSGGMGLGSTIEGEG